MDNPQLGGICFVLAALFAAIWWRLKIGDDLRKRDNPEDDE